METMTDSTRAFLAERLDGIERQALGLAGVILDRNLSTVELDRMSQIFDRAKEDAFLPCGRHELLMLIAIIAQYLQDGL